MKNKMLSYLFKAFLVFGVCGTIFAGIDIYQHHKRLNESNIIEVTLSKQEIKTHSYQRSGARGNKKGQHLQLYALHNGAEIRVDRLKTGGFNSNSEFKWGMSEEIDWNKIKSTYPIGRVFKAYYHPIEDKLYLEKGDILSSILLFIAGLTLLFLAGLIEIVFKPKY